MLFNSLGIGDSTFDLLAHQEIQAQHVRLPLKAIIRQLKAAVCKPSRAATRKGWHRHVEREGFSEAATRARERARSGDAAHAPEGQLGAEGEHQGEEFGGWRPPTGPDSAGLEMPSSEPQLPPASIWA
jgi:hypothetical protein